MTHQYPDPNSVSDRLKEIYHPARPIRSMTQIWVVTCHQYGISALVSRMSFQGHISGGVTKINVTIFQCCSHFYFRVLKCIAIQKND